MIDIEVKAEKIRQINRAREVLAEARRYVTVNQAIAEEMLENASEIIEEAFGGICVTADECEDRLVGNLTDARDWILSAPTPAVGYIDGVRQTLAVIVGRLEKLS